MKKILFLLSIIFIFLLFGCSHKNNLTEEDIKTVIEENNLNTLNFENCGYKGEDIPLEVESVTIEKSNINKDEASCDTKVILANDLVEAELFYRFDLIKEKDGWKMTDFKNYGKYTLAPFEGIDDETALEDAKNAFSEDYSYTIDSNSFDEETLSCTVAVSYTGKSDVGELSGTLTLTYSFDTDTLEWNLDTINEEVSHMDSWNPEGQWRFKDANYYYRINISHLDFENETAKVKVTASEYESVVDTASFQQEADVILTKIKDDIYLEPIEVELLEDTVNLMLCIKKDSLYFATDRSGEYQKANLPRYSKNEY